MHKKNPNNKYDQKFKTPINYSEQANQLDMPFIVSNELNFPFLINLGRTQKSHFNHHRILTSM